MKNIKFVFITTLLLCCALSGCTSSTVDEVSSATPVTSETVPLEQGESSAETDATVNGASSAAPSPSSSETTSPEQEKLPTETNTTVNNGSSTVSTPTLTPAPSGTAPLEQTIPSNTTGINGAALTVQLTFNHAGTLAANQYAVWIENADGELVKTLYVSNFTANGGYRTRPESLATWVSKANPAGMEDTQVDAVSSATPQSGAQSYSWDGTDENGEALPAGDYHVFVEGTMYWTSSVLYSGNFAWGGASGGVAMTPSYTETGTETNKDMISQVSAQYTAGT